ncbi:MAG: hypothetical protein HYV07_31855 [Deltaproteobacteria bacterium]|nr:hypothetical protein [Deltaproteobacteria bacterium]
MRERILGRKLDVGRFQQFNSAMVMLQERWVRRAEEKALSPGSGVVTPFHPPDDPAALARLGHRLPVSRVLGHREETEYLCSSKPLLE